MSPRDLYSTMNPMKKYRGSGKDGSRPKLRHKENQSEWHYSEGHSLRMVGIIFPFAVVHGKNLAKLDIALSVMSVTIGETGIVKIVESASMGYQILVRVVVEFRKDIMTNLGISDTL